MAKRYQVFDSTSKVMGMSAQGYINCIVADEIAPYLRKYNLVKIDPMGWYSLQTLLDLLSDLYHDHPDNAMYDFVSIGMKTLEMTPFPPEMESLPFEQLVMGAGQVYQASHQGDAGYVKTTKVGDKRLRQETKTPYPDDLMYGAIYAMAKRFLPKGTSFSVEYDANTVRRDKGGELTIFNISWK